MAEWGNNDGQRYDVDMESPANGGRYLKINNYNAAGPALHAINSNADAVARALKAEGVSELKGKVWVGPGNADADIDVINQYDINLGPTANEVHLCQINHPTHVEGNLQVHQILGVGPGNGEGQIDANSSGGDWDLKIGTGATTEDVIIGRAGQNVESSAAKMDFEGELRVGPTDAAGLIDSGGVAGAATDRDLKVGTQTVTQDVYLSRNGQTTYVNGGMSVSQNANVGGTLQTSGNTTLLGTLSVGPLAGAGSIDAGGNPNAQNLNIGGGAATANVGLGRANQTVDVNCQERMNSNAIVLNGANNITAANGIGIIVNAAGHGNGPSIDFYINGVMVRYCDVTGWF